MGRLIVQALEVELVRDWQQRMNNPEVSNRNRYCRIKQEVLEAWVAGSNSFWADDQVWPNHSGELYGCQVDDPEDPGWIKVWRVSLKLRVAVPLSDHGRDCYYVEVTSSIEWDRSKISPETKIKDPEEHETLLILPARWTNELGKEEWQRQYTVELDSEANSFLSRSIVSPFTHTLDDAIYTLDQTVRSISSAETLDISKPSTETGTQSVQSGNG